MDIIENIQIELTPKDLKDILVEYFKKQGYEIEDYHTKLKEEYTNINEGYLTFFNGISIKAKKIKEEVK